MKARIAIVLSVLLISAVYFISGHSNTNKISDFRDAPRDTAIESLKDMPPFAVVGETKIPDVPIGDVAENVPVNTETDRLESVKINVIVKNGARTLQEILLCRPDPGAKTLMECKKQSDFSVISNEDINTMVLREFFTEEGGDKWGMMAQLNQIKHAYTNQSGPQVFHCVDKCTAWKPVSNTNGCEVGTTNIGCHTSVTSECVDWSHACTCIKNCY